MDADPLGPLSTPSWLASGELPVLDQIIHGRGHQLVFDVAHAEIPEIVHQVTPGVIELLHAGDERHDAAHLELTIEHIPAAEQQCDDALQMIAEVHQEIHGELQLEDPHVELEHPLDGSVIHRLLALALRRLDDADAEAAQHLNARGSALDDRLLHERHEDQLWHEDRHGDERHPDIEVNQIRQH